MTSIPYIVNNVQQPGRHMYLLYTFFFIVSVSKITQMKGGPLPATFCKADTTVMSCYIYCLCFPFTRQQSIAVCELEKFAESTAYLGSIRNLPFPVLTNLWPDSSSPVSVDEAGSRSLVLLSRLDLR